MKIAGRKNDGAWYRANKMIHNLQIEESTSLATLIQALPGLAGAFAIIQDFATATGLALGEDGGAPSTAVAWGATLAITGIPRQVWFGRLSFDTYTRSGSPGDYEYEQDHGQAMHEFAKQLRKCVKEYTFMRRSLYDLGNIYTRNAGNPGGIANAEVGD